MKTLERWKKCSEDKRRGPRTVPANKLSEEEREEIIKIATSEEFKDDSPCQIVPALADRGKYVASESTFYRILREEKMLEHRGKSKERNYNNKPAPLVATGPNQVYSWDITYLKAAITGTFFYLYMFMDIFSRKIVGFTVHETESMDFSSRLLSEICKAENISREQLVLHSDNGSPMKGATMLATMKHLGVVPSFSRPKVSDDNPYSESLFKTLKYCPEYPSKPFSSIEAAREWVEQFVDWYNNKHLHSGIKFVTPEDRHRGKDSEILKRRKVVYETAKLSNPNRWSGKTRNWDRVECVYLNYLHEEGNMNIQKAS